jgi:2,3,4,5-tetrahydropyridine-2-carboxylate N-succinyltransferase
MGINMEALKNTILDYFDNGINGRENQFKIDAAKFIEALNSGKIRSAEPKDGKWIVNKWVKTGILTLFKYGKLTDYSIDENYRYFDKDTLPLRPMDLDSAIRVIPGGSTIRGGCYVASGVICVPPMYINIGAYVDEGSMIDSHALVGTCAQIGKNCHISAAAQIGGVLEPAGAVPVIIEDDVMVGGNCGVYEGVIVRKGAVLGTGVIINASTRVYDLVNETVIQAEEDKPLEIPEKAVVIPGSRTINKGFGKENGLSISTPIIIKYRDDKTDMKTALNDLLR